MNIEAQKKHNPGYSLIRRATFHGCRLISSQYGVEFEEPDFDGIKKVVSIWLCMTSPAHEDSGITEYNFMEKNLVGKINNEEQEYDLIQTVMVYIGSSAENIENELLKLLHLIFRARMKAAEKAEQLKSDFDVILDNSMAKELNIMCNLSEGIAEEAREEGKIEMVLNYIRKKKISIDAALEDLDVPDAKRPQYTARLQQLMS